MSPDNKKIYSFASSLNVKPQQVEISSECSISFLSRGMTRIINICMHVDILAKYAFAFSQ